MINFKSVVAGIICFMFIHIPAAMVEEIGLLSYIIGILAFIAGFWMYKRSNLKLIPIQPERKSRRRRRRRKS